MAFTAFLRSCGVGSIASGILFVVWGYIDKSHIPPHLHTVETMLSIVVPALFLVGLAGLSVLCKKRGGLFIWAGLILALFGPVWGVMESIADFETLYVFFAHLRLPPYLIGWLLPLLTGLTLVGIATVETRTLNSLGTLPLAMGVFGWIYYLTDSGALLEARSVHVGFGLMFGLCWVALGGALLAVRTGQQLNRTRAADFCEHR